MYSWSEQNYDSAGKTSVKLQKLLLVLIIIATVSLIWEIVYLAVGGGFYWSFLFSMLDSILREPVCERKRFGLFQRTSIDCTDIIALVILLLGCIGARFRSKNLLLTYAIIQLIITIIIAAGLITLFFEIIIAPYLIVTNDSSLPRNVIIVILVFFWLSFVFRLIVLIITILSIALAFRLSNKLRNNVIYITTPESSQKTYVPPSYAESQIVTNQEIPPQTQSYSQSVLPPLQPQPQTQSYSQSVLPPLQPQPQPQSYSQSVLPPLQPQPQPQVVQQQTQPVVQYNIPNPDPNPSQTQPK